MSNVARMTQLTVTGVVPVWTVGDRLRKARAAAHLSQSDFEALTGISRRSISAYEGDERAPRRPQLIAWAMATGVPLAWLESGTTNPRQDGPGGGVTLPRLESNQQPSGYTKAQVIALRPAAADAGERVAA